MVVYFTCQITMCTKRDNGCEGITPPICQFEGLPSTGGVPTFNRNNTLNQVDNTGFGNSQTTTRATTGPYTSTLALPGSQIGTSEDSYNNYQGGEISSYLPNGNGTNTYGLPYTNFGYGLFANGLYGGYLTYPQFSTFPTYTTTTTPATTTVSTTTFPNTAPTEAIIFRAEVAAARHARSDKIGDSKEKKNVTIGVVADQLIILTKDDKMHLNADQEISGCSSIRTKAICLAVVFATLMLSSLVIILQQMYFRRKLLQFGGFSPPFELTNIKS
uniref:ZP domain-containing protein n=1 Tax=Acrobeloides nanus TaxID=290746 RepID=A0A914E1D8_9BILA